MDCVLPEHSWILYCSSIAQEHGLRESKVSMCSHKIIDELHFILYISPPHNLDSFYCFTFSTNTYCFKQNSKVEPWEWDKYGYCFTWQTYPESLRGCIFLLCFSVFSTVGESSLPENPDYNVAITGRNNPALSTDTGFEMPSGIHQICGVYMPQGSSHESGCYTEHPCCIVTERITVSPVLQNQVNFDKYHIADRLNSSPNFTAISLHYDL